MQGSAFSVSGRIQELETFLELCLSWDGGTRGAPHLTARPEALVDLPRSWASFLSWSMNINSSFVESAAHRLLIQRCIPGGSES